MLPRAWVDQAADLSVVITPIKVAPIAVANMILRVDVRQGTPTPRNVEPGGFIEMHPEVITDFPTPVRYLDAVHHVNGRPAVWLSAVSLRDDPDRARRAARMIAAGRSLTSPLAGDGTGRDAFHAYLFVAQPTGLATVGLADGWGVGLVLSDSAAFLRTDDLHVAGTPRAEELLRAHLSGWEQAGRPDHTALQPLLQPDRDGFRARVAMRKGTADPLTTRSAIGNQ